MSALRFYFATFCFCSKNLLLSPKSFLVTLAPGGKREGETVFASLRVVKNIRILVRATVSCPPSACSTPFLLLDRAPPPTLEVSEVKMADDGDLKQSKLFVYGVNSNCPREVLEETFGKIGQVEDVHITDKGYAFVTMADPNDAENAIAELNGSTMDGQEIKVDRATGRKGGGGRG